MSEPPQIIKIWCSLHGRIDNIFTKEWLGKSYNSYESTDIPNTRSNPEPSKQW